MMRLRLGTPNVLTNMTNWQMIQLSESFASVAEEVGNRVTVALVPSYQKNNVAHCAGSAVKGQNP
jgi:hypothetical protein